MNVFAGEWRDRGEVPPGWGTRHNALVERGHGLGLSVYELEPGQTQCPYHFHHVEDELLLVLRGRPTVRTPDGERELEPGDVVHFPRGPAGGHQVWNASAEPARYVVASASADHEIVEYPDSGKVLAASRLGPIWTMHRRENEVDYFDGEQPHAAP